MNNKFILRVIFELKWTAYPKEVMTFCYITFAQKSNTGANATGITSMKILQEYPATPNQYSVLLQLSSFLQCVATQNQYS